MEKLIYKLSYMLNLTPWEPDQMPKEIVETLQSGKLTPANALDIGCGSGSYSIYLAKQGWRVTGIDYITSVIKKAKKKAKLQQVRVDFRVGDITQLGAMKLPSMKLVLDIKCSHGLSPENRLKYIEGLCQLMEEDSLLLLEAVHPRSEMGIRFGMTERDILDTFGQRFTLTHSVQNEDSGCAPIDAARTTRSTAHRMLF